MMRCRMRLLPMVLALPLAALPGAAAGQRVGPLDGSRQMVVVTTAGWDSARAVLQRLERIGWTDAWRPVGPPMAAVVGRSGLGWGEGLHVEPGDGPLKREGDGRAPAGVFRLSSAFGYAAPSAVPWIRLPYVQAHAGTECVDDPRSAFYNRRVNRDTVAAPDWSSHEELRRGDELYRLAVWVDHNSDPPEPGRGSCIFLHAWSGPGSSTSGCTAFAPADVELLLRWLEPNSRPVLVQLPRDEYGRRREAWGLP